MSRRRLLSVIGAVVGSTGMAMLIPAVTALIYQEYGDAWQIGLVVFLALLLAFTKLIQPSYSALGVQGLAISVLPLALAAVGQAIVVIAGGIDLSIASMMSLTSVVAAVLMKDRPEEFAVLVVVGVILLGLAIGAVNGALVVLTRVPDIVLTLAMSFVWAGFALLVLLLIFATRGLQSLLNLFLSWERAVYVSYFVVGGILSIVGLLLMKKRTSAF